jgi:F-type H+-transporting ATPase subunit gamma
MPSLKDYRTRIASVKNTRKITSAMKMVAASKLRQAQNRAEQAQPYAQRLNDVLARLVDELGQIREGTIPLLDGTGADKKVLLIVVAADRGLSGGFSTNLVRDVRRRIHSFQIDGKAVSIITIGRKARDILKREFKDLLIGHHSVSNGFDIADTLMHTLTEQFAQGAFDKAYIVFNHFKNTMTQIPTMRQLIPFQVPETVVDNMRRHDTSEHVRAGHGDINPGVYGFEPDAQTMLATLLPLQISAEIYRVMLESAAGEQAARMTAMDNATRNAGDMINGLTLSYNRARQTAITREVSEIVAGAEASKTV